MIDERVFLTPKKYNYVLGSNKEHSAITFCEPYLENLETIPVCGFEKID